MTLYYAFIHKDPDSIYGATFPDLPGCTSSAKTMDELQAMLAEALLGHIETLAEFGEDVPPPRPLDQVIQDEEAKEALAVLGVPLEFSGKFVRVNITVPENALKKIDNAAKSQGLSRSAYMVQSAVQSVEKTL